MSSAITFEEFLDAAKEFVQKSNQIGDGWALNEDNLHAHGTYVKKEMFILNEDESIGDLVKVEYVIFYNLSYGVPSFSFNLWKTTGTLLSLEDVRRMSFIEINQKDFYSVITQQEHPLFHRPYFIVHPCHTESLLAAFKNKTKNIIVTFLGLITPLLRLDLPLEYGLL